MKFAVLIIACILAFFTTTGQTRRANPAPQPIPSPQVQEPRPQPRRVTLRLKSGEPVSGDLAGANSTSIQITVAGNLLTVKWDELAGLDFTDSTQPKATTSPATELGTLTIEAGLVYNFGGSQPVARTSFQLLDQSLEEILRMAGLSGRNNVGLVASYGLAVKYPLTNGAFLTTARQAIAPHIIADATTDFAGKGLFTDIKPGDYFIMGVTETRRGFAVWNVPVKIKSGANTITLDQNNASAAL